jgi:hypothetical protein
MIEEMLTHEEFNAFQDNEVGIAQVIDDNDVISVLE